MSLQQNDVNTNSVNKEKKAVLPEPKTLLEYHNLDLRRKKKFLEKFVGHKVEEIVPIYIGISPTLCVNSISNEYIRKDNYEVRFRHEECAYSNIYLFQEEDGLSAKFRNFTTGGMDDKLS